MDKKLFWKYFKVRTEKLHRIKVLNRSKKDLKSIFHWGKSCFFRAKNLSINTWRSGPDICSLICGWTPLQVSIVCIIEHTLLLLIFHTFLWIAFYSEDYNNLQFWHTVKSNMTNQTVKPNYFLSISSNWRFHIWWFGLVNLQLLIFIFISSLAEFWHIFW